MTEMSLGKPLIHLQTVDSTNNYALALARQPDTAGGTVILADFQTDGRGQGKNRWQSEAGLNLLFSIILRPVTVPAYRQFYLSMAVATGITASLKRLGIPAQVKWPNDILVHGKKIAGILIENTIMGPNLYTSVIGIGLNVNQTGFPADLPAATSLRLETGREHLPVEILKPVLEGIEAGLSLLYADQYGRIKADYLNSLWMLNRETTMKDATATFRGRIADVAETGALIVRGPDGKIREYGFREVSFGG
jgi:BirA family biotin operon repressor/biotin-[acetyl-CoA-carboxylase] ligase